MKRGRRFGDRGDRSVRAKVGDAPAVLAQGEPERDQGQVVLLARGACKERARAGTPIPAAREAEHTAAQEVAGEVFLRNRDLTALPALAQIAENREGRSRAGRSRA